MFTFKEIPPESSFHGKYYIHFTVYVFGRGNRPVSLLRRPAGARTADSDAGRRYGRQKWRRFDSEGLEAGNRVCTRGYGLWLLGLIPRRCIAGQRLQRRAEGDSARPPAHESAPRDGETSAP